MPLPVCLLLNVSFTITNSYIRRVEQRFVASSMHPLDLLYTKPCAKTWACTASWSYSHEPCGELDVLIASILATAETGVQGRSMVEDTEAGKSRIYRDLAVTVTISCPNSPGETKRLPSSPSSPYVLKWTPNSITAINC